MVYFDASDPSAGTEYHDVIINDPLLTEHGFTKFKLPLNGNAIKMILDNDKDRSLITYVDFDKHDLDKSVKLLQDKLVDEQQVEDKADKGTVEALVSNFRNACILLSEDPTNNEFFKNGSGNRNGKSSSSSEQQQKQKQKQKSKPKRQYSTYKYSNKGKGNLHEASLLSGLPAFLKYENGEIKTIQQIEESSRIIKPPNIEEYPYEPYEFVNVEEVRSYFDRAKKETIDSLFEKAKSIVLKYNDQDEHKLILLAGDIVWSYFQDRFSTTHYVIIVGGNGSGKTTIGDTFAAAAYRTVTMTDPSAANIFRVLGKIEYGQCTIVMDEAEKVDKSADLMSILKAGYQFNARVSKINMNEEVQQWFYPYCLKFIIAERSPNQNDAKGVLDRTFSYTTYKGKPQYDIKEVLNPAGDQGRQQLLDELIDFRKLTLVYRLIHFRDPILDIDIGLDGRDKELCKPLLQLFDNTESYVWIKWALQKFLDAKNQKKGNLIEAALHPIIVNLVSGNGNEVRASNIWDDITSGTIEGYRDDKKPNEYQSTDYGTIYRNTITNIICDKFGAEKRRDKHGSILKFDVEKLARAGKIYNIESNIQTKIATPSTEDGRRAGDSGDSGVGSAEAQSSSKQVDDIKNVKNQLDDRKKSPDISTNPANPSIDKGSKQSIAPKEPTQPTQPTPTALKSIYRLGHSDTWACSRKNCNLRGDKWFMQKHNCKGAKK
jgi:hypothetical protein